MAITVATYSVLTTVAPVRSGMQPKLSLNYASGNGILGMGWNKDPRGKPSPYGRLSRPSEVGYSYNSLS